KIKMTKMMQHFAAPWGQVKEGEIWAITGESDSGHCELLAAMQTNTSLLVSFRHHFRNLSNTADFYYQQRFNSGDSDDAPTVNKYLTPTGEVNGFWPKEKIIKRLRLEPLLDEPVIKLSNGETKRLLIASALLNNPSLLLLDHPLSGLDVSTRADLDGLIEEISTSGIMVVLATGPWEIPGSISNIAIMQKGKITHLIKKKEFIPENFGMQHSIKINRKLLGELLSIHESKSFHVIVEMNNVTIKYQDKIILENVNWKIKQGERWALSGHNGAGKSTLLSLINGDNPQAYANNITLFDRRRGSGESIWDIKKNTGFVSPELYQYFPMDSTCIQVIESGFYDTIGLFRQSDTDMVRTSLMWMKLMNIDSGAFTLFNRVSPPVQRLCILARALVKNPPLLILDEPTQGLDHTQQQFFTELINAICDNSNVTLIYVSHFREHIPAAVTHLLQLESGKVILNN
ncbi:MAG: ATP-binding cassette domain-containing protein, partial [Flavitalea sp.]